MIASECLLDVFDDYRAKYGQNEFCIIHDTNNDTFCIAKSKNSPPYLITYLIETYGGCCINDMTDDNYYSLEQLREEIDKLGQYVKNIEAHIKHEFEEISD